MGQYQSLINCGVQSYSDSFISGSVEVTLRHFCLFFSSRCGLLIFLIAWILIDRITLSLYDNFFNYVLRKCMIATNQMMETFLRKAF